ncbi:hypothetical protein BVY03_00645, partial [bacterium K02(2017)]
MINEYWKLSICKIVVSLVLCFFVLHVDMTYANDNRIFNTSNDDALIQKLKEKKILSESDIKEIEAEKEKLKKNHSINLSARAQFL